MRSRFAPLAVAAVVAALVACAGCENSSPPAGEACRASGGICSSVSCGTSLPYPCPEGESCCEPPPSHDAGAGD